MPATKRTIISPEQLVRVVKARKYGTGAEYDTQNVKWQGTAEEYLESSWPSRLPILEKDLSWEYYLETATCPQGYWTLLPEDFTAE